MIQRRQDLDLGTANANDPRPVPTRPEPQGRDPRATDTQPATRNPAATELPATATIQPATTQPEGSGLTSAMPVMIDVPADAPTYDLEQILSYAIEKSPEYRNAKDELFLTTIAVLRERHLWGPRFFETVSAQVVGQAEPGDAEHAAQLIHELGVSQRLPNGGQVSVSALVDFVEGLRNSTADEKVGAGVVVDATIPLLRGAGGVAREDLIQTERNLIYSVRQFERFRREFLVRVATQYYELLRLQSQIRNRQRQVVNYQRLSQRIEALSRAGRQPYFEVQRSQQQALFARNNLVNVQEQYASTLDQLKVLIGMPVTQPVNIAFSEAVIPQPALDPVESVNAALRFRLDLQTTADRVADARRRLDNAKNGMLPDLDVYARGRFPVERNLARGGGLNSEVTANSYVAGATFGVPLDRRVEELDVRRAKVVLERSQRDYQLAQDQVGLQVRRAIRQIEQARFSLNLQDRNVALARRREYGVQLRLRELGPRDFIEAQEDLLSALNRRDDALRALRASILQYLLDTGQMRVDSQGRWQSPALLVRTDALGTPGTSGSPTTPATAPSLATPSAGIVSDPPAVDADEPAPTQPDSTSNTASPPPVEATTP